MYRTLNLFQKNLSIEKIHSHGSIQVSPTFHKFALCHFAIMRDLHQYLFSVATRNPEIFAFMKKGEKQK